MRKNQGGKKSGDPESVESAIESQLIPGEAPWGFFGESSEAMREPSEGDTTIDGGGQGVARK